MYRKSRWLFLTVGAGSLEFEQAAERLTSQARKFPNFDAFVCIKTQALISLFPELNLDTAMGSRGFGYYRWKSKVVNLALSGFWGEFEGVCFVDAGCDMNANAFTIRQLGRNLKKAELSGVLAYTISTPERFMTKRKVLEFFNFEDDYSDQFQSGTIYLHGLLGRSIAQEWDQICSHDISFSDDSPSPSGEFSDFYEHRHDQSVFSLILKKNSIKPNTGHPPGKPFGFRLQIENLLSPIWWSRNRTGRDCLRLIEKVAQSTSLALSELQAEIVPFCILASKRYVYIRLGGGLGNQLHQFVAAKAVSQSSGKKLLVDIEGIAKSDHGPNSNATDFYLDGYISDNRLISLYFRIKRKVYNRTQEFSTDGAFYLAKNPGYVPDLLQKSLEISYLEGYFHTYKYSDEISRKLNNSDLVLINQTSDWFQNEVASMRNKNVCALHIRRGDYEQTWRHYGVLSKSYYESAITSEIDTEQVDSFWIFTDATDLDLSLWDFLDSSKVKLVKPPPGISAADSLVLMSRAKWIITANSTFSWWAGFLEAPEAKRVVCPETFFRIGQNINELYPDDWAKVTSLWTDY
jgi:hypothetical protein